MSSISGPGATPPLEPLKPQDETSRINQARQNGLHVADALFDYCKREKPQSERHLGS